MEAKFKSAGVEVKMPDLRATKYPNAERVESTSKGRLIWELDYNDHSIPPAHGTSFAEGDVVAYLETPNGIEEVKTNFAGKIVSVEKQQGDLVEKGDYIADVATPTKYYSVEGDNVYFSLVFNCLVKKEEACFLFSCKESLVNCSKKVHGLFLFLYSLSY